MKKKRNQSGNVDLKQPVRELIDELKKYIDLQLEYNKVAYRKKTARVTGQLLLYAMIFGLFVFVMMFLSFAFVNWYNARGGTRTDGFLWVSAFYLLIALILYAFREPLLFSKIRKIFGKNLSGSREKQFIVGSGFEDEQMTDKYLEHLRDLNRKQESQVQQHWQMVNRSFNVINIIKVLVHQGIQTFVTTRNIIETAFQVTQKIKSKRRNKNRKELKEES
jgi:hypothetical protein